MPIATFLGGGDISLSQFSDGLNVVDPNSTTGFGVNWIQAIKTHYPLVDPVQSSTGIIQNTNFDAAKGLTWNHEGSGAASTNWMGLLIPIKGNLFQNLNGKTQFCQCTLLQNTGNWRTGLAVCVYPAEQHGFTGYELELTNIATTWFLQRVVADTFTVIASGNDAFVGGDVLRLSADQSVSGQTTLVFKKNGTTISTFIDNNASHITIGSPALHARISATVAANAEWRTFSCGTGT